MACAWRRRTARLDDFGIKSIRSDLWIGGSNPGRKSRCRLRGNGVEPDYLFFFFSFLAAFFSFIVFSGFFFSFFFESMPLDMMHSPSLVD